jgi:hypothetical protein
MYHTLVDFSHWTHDIYVEKYTLLALPRMGGPPQSPMQFYLALVWIAALLGEFIFHEL